MDILNIFILRTLGIYVGSIRIMWLHKNNIWVPGALGFIEQILFIVTTAWVIMDFKNIYASLAYAGGFSAGTMLSMLTARRMKWNGMKT